MENGEWRMENGEWRMDNLAGSLVVEQKGGITPLPYYPITTLKMHSGRGASHLLPRLSGTREARLGTRETPGNKGLGPAHYNLTLNPSPKERDFTLDLTSQD
jgi:hypothetical protein